MKYMISISVVLIVLILAVSGYPISRDNVMNTAYSYYTATWTCSSANADPAWNTFTPGSTYQGIPYNMHGYDTLSTAFWKLAHGVIAGNHLQYSTNTWTESHAGVDCSGYVCRTWGEDTYHFLTSEMYKIATTISWSDLLRGDVLNSSGQHVRLFDYFTNGTTEMMVYESTVHVPPEYIDQRVTHRILNRLNSTHFPSGYNYIPRRYKNIQEVPYPHPPYQDMVYSMNTYQQPWIIGGVGGVGKMSWNPVGVATTAGGTAPGSDSMIGQLQQANWGTGYAYTGAPTDTNYTVEAYVWCRYNNGAIDTAFRYNSLLSYFYPWPMRYIQLSSDFTLPRNRLMLQVRDTTGLIASTLNEWQSGTDFPTISSSGWHHLRLSVLDGTMKVWFDGNKLSDPTTAPYTGFTTGFVACSQYSSVSGENQTGWFDALKVYPTRMTLNSATVINLDFGKSTTLELIGGIPMHLWSLSTTGIVSLNTTAGATVVVTAIHNGTVTLTARDNYSPQQTITIRIEVQGIPIELLDFEAIVEPYLKD
ncbi:MAG: hypothetical protein ACE14V_07380 [bacterium]